MLAAASATPLWGKFSDIFGRKPVLLAANAVFFVGSLLAAVSVSIAMLIVGRAVQGHWRWRTGDSGQHLYW